MSDTQPLVSILIPCYNSAPYIAETLDSVIAQTYTNWECIVVDDHSSDRSVKIVEEYCQQYPGKIKLYTNPRKGACAARNYAFEKSLGAYIQYLDADDLLSNDKIKKQIQLAQEYNESTLFSCQWDKFLNNKSEATFPKRFLDKSYEFPEKRIEDTLKTFGMTPIMAWLVPQKLILQTGKWNETLLINQDGEFFFRLILHAKKIIFEPEGKVYYRAHSGPKISNRDNKEKVKSLIYSFELYEKNFKKLGDKEKLPNFDNLLANIFFRNRVKWYIKYPEISYYCLQMKNRLAPDNKFQAPILGGKIIEFIKNKLGWKTAVKFQYLKQTIVNKLSKYL